MRDPSFENFETEPEKAWAKIQDLGMRAVSDKEEFLEWWEDLDAEFLAASPEQQREILSNRYFHAFNGDYHAVLEGNQAFVEMKRLKEKGIFLGNVEATISGEDLSSGWPFVDLLELYQYGPSLIANIEPGGWGMMSLKGQDIIASSLFSCCSALIVKEAEKVAFSHVRMGDAEETKKMLKSFAADFKDPKCYLVAPKVDRGDAIYDDRQNARYKQLSKELSSEGIEIQLHEYPYITADMKNNPHGIHSTSVIITRNNLRIIGVKEMHREAGGSIQTSLQPVDETMVDQTI